MGHDLHLPTDGSATAAAVVLHPHPAMGGDRHHPLVIAVTERLAAAGIAALRLDLTDPDVAASAAALEEAAADLLSETGVSRLHLVGYSWGSVVVTLAGPAGLVARVLVAPPVASVAFAAADHVPALVLVPAHDQYGGPDAVEQAIRSWPTVTIEVVQGCDHFLAGAIDRVATRSVEWLTERPDPP